MKFFEKNLFLKSLFTINKENRLKEVMRNDAEKEINNIEKNKEIKKELEKNLKKDLEDSMGSQTIGSQTLEAGTDSIGADSIGAKSLGLETLKREIELTYLLDSASYPYLAAVRKAVDDSGVLIVDPYAKSSEPTKRLIESMIFRFIEKYKYYPDMAIVGSERDSIFLKGQDAHIDTDKEPVYEKLDLYEDIKKNIIIIKNINMLIPNTFNIPDRTLTNGIQKSTPIIFYKEFIKEFSGELKIKALVGFY